MGRKNKKKNHRKQHNKKHQQHQQHDQRDVVINDHLEEHPLHSAWSFWYLGTQKPDWDYNTCGDGLEGVGTVDTVEQFWSYHRNMRWPSHLDVYWNYHLFRGGITPQWEDDANKGGGRWIVFVKSDRKNLDAYWENTLMALIGETLPHCDLICGAVLNRRRPLDKIAVWTKAMTEEQSQELGTALENVLKDEVEYPCTFKLEYSQHPDM